jgi:hypothetical protein
MVHAMKLLILCVDGFDPQFAHENDYDRFRNSACLTIPRECYSETLDGAQPATGKVWPSILSGRIYDQAVTVRKGARRWIHDLLMRSGIRWSGKKRYTVNPWNQDIETFLTGREAFTWNLPTISPEWIAKFPDLDQIVEFSTREYQIFKFLARGLVTDHRHGFELGLIYTRTLDAWGHFTHLKDETDIRILYRDISSEAWRLSEIQKAHNNHLMLISDHGILDGRHTDYAYIGATFPFEADSILDIRSVVEERLSS